MENNNTKTAIDLTIDDLQGILATQHAACTDETLPLLNGIHLRSAETRGLIAEATDRYQAIRAYLPNVETDNQKIDVVIPAKDFVKACRQITKRNSWAYRLVLDTTTWQIECFNTEASASGKLLDGTYPLLDNIFLTIINATPANPYEPYQLQARLLAVFDKVRKTLKLTDTANVVFTRRPPTKPQAWFMSTDRAEILGMTMPIRATAPGSDKPKDLAKPLPVCPYINGFGALTHLPGKPAPDAKPDTGEARARVSAETTIKAHAQADAYAALDKAKTKAEAKPVESKPLAQVKPVSIVIDSKGVHGSSKTAKAVSEKTGVPVAKDDEPKIEHVSTSIVTGAGVIRSSEELSDETVDKIIKAADTPEKAEEFKKSVAACDMAKPKAKTKTKAKGKPKAKGKAKAKAETEAPVKAVESEAAPVTDAEKRERLAAVYSMTPKMIDRIFTALTDKGMNPEDACEWALGDHKRTSKRYLAALEIVRSA